ncbi:ATPase AAA, partial [Candidatus Magnetomorum sp. HK-1]
MSFLINELLKSSEGKTLEFKRDLSSPKNFLKTLVAFANSAGGRLVFGIEDKTQVIVGLENPLDEEERLCNIIADTIEPRLVPNIEMATIEKKILLIEVENPGILLPGLTIDDICRGVSKLRNRVISRVFRELNLIEEWGSGIPRIYKESKKLGLPLPEIVEIGMRLRFIIYLKQSFIIKQLKKQPELRPESQPELRPESQPELRPNRRSGSLKKRVIGLLSLGEPLSKVELSVGLNQKEISGQLNKVVKSLLAESIIEYT